MQEIWEPVEESQGYAVSNYGRIEDLDHGRVIHTRPNAQGFMMVTLRNDAGGQITRSVALLVARAFLEQPHRWFTSIIHLNGDRSDCRAMNLMWRSRPFVLRYHQMFEEEPIRLAVQIRETGEYFGSLRELCTTYGLIERMTYNNAVNGEPCFPYGWSIEVVNR